MTSDCKGIVGWLFGHKYQGRFHVGEPADIELHTARSTTALALVEASKPQTYVRDVCARCGDVIQLRGASE